MSEKKKKVFSVNWIRAVDDVIVALTHNSTFYN